jgi:hypothetical protein
MLTARKINHANFDVTHELDEFLMVERPLTHSKRKANADLDKLGPELRELEEQYVFVSPPTQPTLKNFIRQDSRFTTSVDHNACHIILTTNRLVLEEQSRRRNGP